MIQQMHDCHAMFEGAKRNVQFNYFHKIDICTVYRCTSFSSFSTPPPVSFSLLIITSVPFKFLFPDLCLTQTEDFEPYFTGRKRLLPRPSDLSFYNWETQTATSNPTPNYQVCIKYIHSLQCSLPRSSVL